MKITDRWTEALTGIYSSSLVVEEYAASAATQHAVQVMYQQYTVHSTQHSQTLRYLLLIS